MIEFELENLLKSYPKEVEFSKIIEFDKLDERISSVGVLFSNTNGVNEKSIEFCPNNEPSLIEEVISWIWTFRPDLGNEMDEFWEYISE